MNPNISLLVLCFFMVSCHLKDNSNQTLNFIGDYVYSSDFIGYNRFVKIDDKQYVCRVDMTTRKKMNIKSIDETEDYTIDLKEVVAASGSAFAYEFYNLDTILILQDYSRVIRFINREGEVWKTIDFSPYLENPSIYELGFNANLRFKLNDTSLIFSINYTPDIVPTSIEGNEKEIAYYYNWVKKNPILFKVDNVFSDSISAHLGASDIYNSFTKPNEVSFEHSQFKLLNGQIIFTSRYSDSLYIVDPVKLTVINKVKIQSQYSKLFVKPITVSQFSINPDSIEENDKTTGHIENVCFNKLKGIYFCCVSHQSEAEIKPWSILVLDRNFKQIDEIKMDESKYYHGAKFSEQMGLTLNLKKSKDDSDYFTKSIYHRYEYKSN